MTRRRRSSTTNPTVTAAAIARLIAPPSVDHFEPTLPCTTTRRDRTRRRRDRPYRSHSTQRRSTSRRRRSPFCAAPVCSASRSLRRRSTRSPSQPAAPTIMAPTPTSSMMSTRSMGRRQHTLPPAPAPLHRRRGWSGAASRRRSAMVDEVQRATSGSGCETRAGSPRWGEDSTGSARRGGTGKSPPDWLRRFNGSGRARTSSRCSWPGPTCRRQRAIQYHPECWASAWSSRRSLPRR